MADDERLKELTAVSRSILHMQRMILFNQSEPLRADILRGERGKDPRRLLTSGYRVYSQNDEDGILAEIYRRIGFGSRIFFEFGVEGGLENNTCLLLMQGWSGAWIEANPKSAETIQNNFKEQLLSDQLFVKNDKVSAENINDLIRECKVDDADFLSIDIDGNDYWVWKAIEAAWPRVVAIEYNAIMPPTHEWIIRYDKNHRYDGTNYHGASLRSLEILGREKGYSLVGCNIRGVNAFFVRNDLIRQNDVDLFCSPYTAENHYEPFRHPYLKVAAGKRMSSRPGVEDPAE